jgi:hypothetical protein
MAEFNYNKYVATMAQRKGPMFEYNDANQLDNSYLDQLDLTTKIAEIEDTDVEASEDEFDSAEFDKEPSKKDIKAAEKEFSLEVPKADAGADPAFEKAKQIIKIKVGKLLSQPKGKRTASPDMAALKQFIQKPEIKKAFKSRGLDVMDFVKDVIA